MCGGQRSLAFRLNHRYIMLYNEWKYKPWQPWKIISNKWSIYVKQLQYFALLTLVVNQNLLVLSAKCFYLSGDLFPGFGYGKPKCVFPIILTLHVIHVIVLRHVNPCPFKHSFKYKDLHCLSKVFEQNFRFFTWDLESIDIYSEHQKCWWFA